MNRISSFSSISQKKKFSQSHPQPQPPLKKRDRIPRNPLKDVNTRSSGAGGGGGSISDSVSGLVSGEAPNGRVRFFLSGSCSSSSGASFGRGTVKYISKTPKSAPVVTKPLPRNKARVLEEIKLKDTVSGKPTSQRPQKCKRTTTMPRLAQSGKRLTCKSSLKTNKTSVLDELSSCSRELKQKERGTTVGIEDNGAHATPVSKLGLGSGQGYGTTGKVVGDVIPSNDSRSNDHTPPVQASVSPEIQFGSSMMLSETTNTQACYAAGHILSGISDKRKCRPKGVLIVGENGLNMSKPKPLNNFDDADEADFAVRDSSAPLPADASMQWLLSPCDEEKDHKKEKFNDDFYQLRQVVGCEGSETPSPLSDRSISSDICNISSGRSLSPQNSGKGMRRSTGSLVSPNEPSHSRSFMYPLSDKDIASAYDTTPTCETDPFLHLTEVRNHQYDIGDKKSPSSIETLGSENVIQTPESNSTSDKYQSLSWFPAERPKNQDLGSDFESLTVALQSASLSPKSHASSWDPNSSSFHFESLARSSDSVDLMQFQRVLGDRRSSHCNSTSGNMSETHMRISWREEINSQITEIDEFDSGRDVSDEENANGSSFNQLIRPRWIQNIQFDKRNYKGGAAFSSEFVAKETASAGKDRESLPCPCSAAESISTDGGGLNRSEDSDWMLCYKNHFLGV